MSVESEIARRLDELSRDYNTLIGACNIMRSESFFKIVAPTFARIHEEGRKLGCAFDANPTLRWGTKGKYEDI